MTAPDQLQLHQKALAKAPSTHGLLFHAGQRYGAAGLPAACFLAILMQVAAPHSFLHRRMVAAATTAGPALIWILRDDLREGPPFWKNSRRAIRPPSSLRASLTVKCE
jgi:hypothetical protein